MKWKLAVSISPLSAGISRRFRTASSSRSMVTFFGRRHCQINSRYTNIDGYSRAKRFESSSRAMHSSMIEGDAFSELGPETSDCTVKKIKLVTEKPEYFVKIDPFGRELAGRSLSSDSRPSTKGIMSAIGRASPTSHPKLGDSSSRAILAGKIAVGDQEYPVHPLDAVDVIAVRIKNISQKTSDYAIHSMCKSVGELVGLARTNEGFVDAFFNMKNDTVHLNILKKLKSTVIDDCRWSAYTLTSNSSNEGAKYKLSSKIKDHLSEMRRQHFLQKINLEDLETLLSSIMHIEETPSHH